MKTNKMMRVASVLLVAVLLTTCAISGTFAKYTTDISATDNAIVAKFAVEAFGVDADLYDTATVKIFNESNVYDTLGANYADGVNDADVADAATDADPIIAPGTWGTFSFDVTNNSDVTVEYDVAYTATENGVPLKWSINGTDWETNLAELDITDDRLEMGATETVTIYWQWDFENTENVDDTALGTATDLAKPEVKIDVNFTQVD